MSRPLLLDLFCGAGGAAVGYHRAGFDVVGVDIKPQSHYPFRFVQANALAPAVTWEAFDAVHASPPCQHYSALAGMHPTREYPALIEPVRQMLTFWGKPFVIENVEHAPLQRASDLFGSHGVMLCGSAFGLGARGRQLRRHRLFESNRPLYQPPCQHQGEAIGVYGHGGHTGKHRMAYADEAREALGIEWMSRDEMTQAIPPAYTQFIGEQLLAILEARV